MIIKPSEKVPLSCGRLAELLKEAGLPDGVFNIMHGDVDIVNAICDHPDIEAVSFVGSTKVAKIVYDSRLKKSTSVKNLVYFFRFVFIFGLTFLTRIKS